MTEAKYIPLDEIEAADLTTCGRGLFQSLRPGTFANVLVTTMGGTRYAVYLDDPKGAMYMASPKGEGNPRAGILWPEPAIEVDTATLYNADYERETLGDLVLSPTPSIIARQPDGWFDDGSRIPLWSDKAHPAKAIGFRSWRLVSVVGDRRRVIFEKKVAPGDLQS